MSNDPLEGTQPDPPLSNREPEVGAEAMRATGDPQPPAGGESPVPPPPPIPPVIDVHDLDWQHIVGSLRPGGLRARIRATVEQLEAMLDSEGDAQRMLFDDQRDGAFDRALKVATVSEDPLWFIGDIHGDLLALNAALALIDRESKREGAQFARIVLLGDLFDDGGYGLETLLQVFELIVKRPQSVCLLAGNHEEALGYNGARFTATVSPSDFCDFLNENLAHEWIGRAGKLAVRIAAHAPRALFFPDGLLAAHGGFPLADLHERLAQTGNWNAPECLSFGPFVRVPTIARWIRGSLPQVYRLHIPEHHIRGCYPEATAGDRSGDAAEPSAT
jgi:hypothetical protein